MGEAAMADTTSSGFKHLVIVKFKEDVKVEEIMKGLQKLVNDIETVKSFEWGQDMESQEGLRQGFTHAFMMTFEKKEDYIEFLSHPTHVGFSSIFSAAIDQIALLDFPSSLLQKPKKPPPLTAKTSPPHEDHDDDGDGANNHNDNNNDDDEKKDDPSSN